MARNVRFIRTTKEKWLNRDSYDPLALYFCEDTQEMCKGDQVLTDGIRVVPTKADLPVLPFAADGVIYYVDATNNGYMMSPDRTEWLQTIYAPVEDVTTVPESELYNTVTTVGAVRDIENAIYNYIDQELENIEVSGSVGKDGLSAYDIWLNAGNTGTEGDFLNSLKGKDGVDGKDGESGNDGYTPVKGVDYFDGEPGKNGEDGKTPYIQDGYWHIDGANTGVKAEGIDGRNGVDGANGNDGKTPYIQDDYWYIDGVNTNVKAKGLDGQDGVNGVDGKSAYDLYCEAYPEYTGTLTEWLASLNGADGKDGLDGKDGASGKDGKSAYETWIDAGYSGSEDDFLQWLKGDTEPFGDVVTSIGFDGIAAGTSLKGKTVKDVLIMLLGVQAPPQPPVQVILTNRIPAYSGTANTGDTEVAYTELDTSTADYRDEGFYVTKDDSGNITNAGYQVAFEGNSEMDAQTFAVPSDAKIVGAYQYDEFGTKTWLEYEFPGSYWVQGDMTEVTVNGETITYQAYSYDVDSVGDAITASEYWRFEIEV